MLWWAQVPAATALADDLLTEPPPGAVAQRQAVLRLSTEARRELTRAWTRLSHLPAEQVRDALQRVLPPLCDRYGLAAGTLAADWYDTLREQQQLSTSFRAQAVEMPDQGRYDALARWGTGPLFQPDPSPAAALTLIGGGVQRIIADQHRLTIVRSTQADPDAVGWMRTGDGSSCGFCRMLIARGAVYRDTSVTFRSHDHCGCGAAPSWDPTAVYVSDEPYQQSQKHRSPATKARDNARAAAWIAAHP